MSLSVNEIDEEKKYLKQTQEVINGIIFDLEKWIDQRVEHVDEFKKYFWENINGMDSAERLGTIYETNLEIGFANENIKRYLKFKKAATNPYFGRIDFTDKHEKLKIYIGLSGVEHDSKFYIFDWRAPISSLYYNYGPGKASYISPGGLVEGEIGLKRQFKIENGQMVWCLEADLNIVDEYLQEILAQSSSDKMKTIVNTIQQEQNQIIRNLDDRYLIVQGTAGSGKTSVAMHRIAFLLYSEKRLSSKNILIFSPNDVFTEYISNVLPDLGENNTLQTTFSDFAKAYINEFSHLESFSAFIERYYSSNLQNDEENEIIKFKLSDEFKNLLDNYITSIRSEASFVTDLIVEDRICSKQYLNNLLKNRYNDLSLVETIERLAEDVCISYDITSKQKSRAVLLGLKKNLNFKLNYVDLYKKFLSSDKVCQSLNINLKNQLNDKNLLNYEDLLGLLYLKLSIQGFPVDRQIKQIVIDEVQDYSILQLSIIRKIFANSSFTILGDINQTINPYYKYDSMSDMGILFENKAKFIELTKTYRSSQEIIEFTNKILGIDINAIRRNNNIPVEIKESSGADAVKNIRDDILRMKSRKMNTIAVITKNSEEAESIYNGLKQHIKEISLITKDDNKLSNKIMVVPSYMSKGLEFDAAISYCGTDNLYLEKDKYLFYVVCTRAQHNLIVYNQK